MSYSDNSMKFVAVLNKKQDLSVLMNALGHITAGLSANVPADQADFLEYKCPGGDFTAAISRYPFIVLAAPNSSQVARFVRDCADLGMTPNVFTTTMLGDSAEAQVQQTLRADRDSLDYVAAVAFGDSGELQPVTKRFSLWR